MMLTFAVETGQSCGRSFRLALGVSLPLWLVWAALKVVGLF